MRLIHLLLASTLLLEGASFAQNDTPLGDVARKKSATAKAKRVITEDDIPSAPLPPEPVAAPKKAADLTEAELATAGVRDGNPDGKPLTPEQKLQTMQAQAEKLKTYEASLSKHLKELSNKLENEPSEFRRNMYSEALQRQAGTLESFKKQRAELESAIAEQKPAASADSVEESSSETPSD